MFIAALQCIYTVIFFGLAQLVPGSAGLAERVLALATMLMMSALQLIFCAVAGVILASIMALVTLPLVYLIVWSLKIRGSVIWLGAFCGGLVGFLATLPSTAILSFVVLSSSADMIRAVLVSLLVGPCLSTVFGQVGGARGGYLAAQHAYPEVIARAPLHSLAGDSHPHAVNKPPQPRLQFRIRHLLWISLWLSVLLTLIRLCGLPYEFILPGLIGWALYQAFTLWLGGKILERFRGCQLRRARST